MPIWLIALVVLLFGIGLAYSLDRMKGRPPSVPGTSPERAEREKWLHYWFFGRFPGKDEQAAEDVAARNKKKAVLDEKPQEEKQVRGGGKRSDFDVDDVARPRGCV